MSSQKNEHCEEDLSLKVFIVLSRALQSIKKRVEEDIKCLGLNPTEFSVLELLYLAKVTNQYKKLVKKY